jgi:P27 family predicted phage terminase small subunit
MRGRKPLPTEVKRVRGNPGKRPLNDREPQPRRVVPRCPDFLDEDAKREWRRVTRLLERNGIVTELDGPTLMAFCQAFSRWAVAERNLQKYGTVILSPDKNFPIQSPYLSIANMAMEQMVKIATEFGMTPSSRSRVTTVPGLGPPDEFDLYLERGRIMTEEGARRYRAAQQASHPSGTSDEED